MFDLILISHGSFAKGIYNTLTMILGDKPDIQYCGIEEGESTEDFATRLNSFVDYDNPKSLLVLLDLYNGSPCLAAISNLLVSKRDCHLITGINLPLVMEAYASRNQDLDKVMKELLLTAKENILYINEMVQHSEIDNEDE